MKHAIAVLAFAAALGGCVTVMSPQMRVAFSATVDDALQKSPADLKAQADTGQARAQLSYSIVLRYGLNGTPVDVAAADHYRALAIAQRGTTTTAIYVPGYAKVPASTELVDIPVYDVPLGAAIVAEACAAALATPPGQAQDVDACGGADNTARLSALWKAATK